MKDTLFRSRLAFLLLAIGLVLPAAGAGASTNSARRVQFREPRLAGYRVSISQQARQSGAKWIKAQRENGSGKVELGSRVVLQVSPGTSLDSFLTNLNVSVSKIVGPNLYILQAPDSATAIDVAESLSGKTGVVVSCPVMRHERRPHNTLTAAPDDPYFNKQWQWDNRGSDGNLAGLNLDARAAWTKTRGTNVIVAVADVGVQLDHPDLASRTSGNPHFNFFQTTADGSPYDSEAAHGTSVAGLIAAEQNNKQGVSGIAPQAGIASWVIFGISPDDGLQTSATDEQFMDMFQYQINRVGVQNHSWGSAVISQEGIDALSDVGISNAVTSGRGGKGVVMVRAAGNSRDELVNANDDAFACDPRAIAVAAVRKDGRACSYSDPGACVLVGAPSGDIIDSDGDGYADSEDPAAPDVFTTDLVGTAGYSTGTTDLGNYAGFNGTSASSPEVAGIVALLLSANTNLTYRDVQHILIQSARHHDLADPDVKTNGAGIKFSHNVGFGVPDAGFALELAQAWSNRPAATQVRVAVSTSKSIPDDALRVVCAGTGLSTSLTNIRCLPSFGPHPDDARTAIPLVYVGLATEELTVDLHGKAALIQRGSSYFYEKIGRAARAGAQFAVIFNNTGTSEIQAMGATDYVPIPAVSIGRTNGEALRDFLSSNPSVSCKLQLSPAIQLFTVTNTLSCEHVGVRVQTTHSCRQDVRVTLVSPSGTRSVLQAINADDSAGPVDWTYWTVQHFCESSAGQWRLEVSDERNTVIGSTPATGTLTYAELIIQGVAITDTDHDGLDDSWETKYFQGLAQGPKDDPDADGFDNAREQLIGTNPAVGNRPFKIDFAAFNGNQWRLSWPSRDDVNYSVFASTPGSGVWATITNFSSSLPVSELIVDQTQAGQLFRLREQ